MTPGWLLRAWDEALEQDREIRDAKRQLPFDQLARGYRQPKRSAWALGFSQLKPLVTMPPIFRWSVGAIALALLAILVPDRLMFLPLAFGVTSQLINLDVPDSHLGSQLRAGGQLLNDWQFSGYSRTFFAGALKYGTGAFEPRIAACMADAEVFRLASPGPTLVLIPLAMLPYNPSLVPPNTNLRLIREGGLSNVYDIEAYGAANAAESTVGIQRAMDAANQGALTNNPSSATIVHCPTGAYTISGAGLTFYSNIVIEGEEPAGISAIASGSTQFIMQSSNAGAFILNPSTPAGAIVANTVFSRLVFSIFNNSNAGGCIDLTNCLAPLVQRCAFSGGTSATGACIKWIGGPVAGNSGFGTIDQCAFSTVAAFGSVFLFGGSVTDQPDGIDITNCYGTPGKTLFKFASNAAAVGGPGSLSMEGCRWEGGGASDPFIVFTTDAKGFGISTDRNRFETTGSGGIQITLQGVGSQMCAQMGKDSYAYGSGGFTLVDNGNIPSVWLGTLRGPSIDVSMSINGLQTRVKTVTADYTLNGSDHTVLVDATAGAVIISMPAINQLPAGQRAIFRIVKIDGTANTVTVHAFPNFINGVSNLVVYERYAALEVTNNGVDWFVTTAHGVSFSPLHVPAFSTISWGSGNAANVGYLQIDGTPKLIISLSGTTQYQATSSDFSPITAGGKTLGAVQPWGVIFSNQGTNDGSFALTSGPTPAVNARNGNYQTLSVLTNIAVVIAVPTNPPATGFSQDLFIAIRNASGGALTTAPTFNTGAGGFKFAGGSIVNPANGTQVIYHWRWDPVQSFYCLVAVSGAL